MEKLFYIKGDRLSKEEKEALKLQGLFSYDLRTWDDGKGTCVEHNVLANHEGVIITNFKMLDEKNLDDSIEDLYEYLDKAKAQEEVPFINKVNEILEKERAKKIFKEGKFMIAGENEIFKGYQNPGYECNGWRAPGFEKEVVEQIVKKLDGKTTYDEKMDQYHYVDKEEGVEEIWVGEDINTPNGKKHVYFVGEGYMWNEAKDDPELEEEELEL